MLQKRLAEIAPEVQFMGEEKDNSQVDLSGAVWVLDPVDGTTNLIHAFSTARSRWLWRRMDKCPRCGIPSYTQECFIARRGGGAFQNGRPIRVSGTIRLAESLLSAGTVPGRRELADEAFRQMRALYDRCQDVRRTGCASLDLCWVACGRLDGYVELSLQPWTTPPECASRRRLEEKSPPQTAAPYPSGRAGLCWPLTGGSTARCKQF